MGLKIVIEVPLIAIISVHENLPSSSKVISGRQTDWWSDKHISFLQSTLQIIPYKTPQLPLREHLFNYCSALLLLEQGASALSLACPGCDARCL
jgi:hypothetical protein